MLLHLLLHCLYVLCMKLRNYKGKHDNYCTSFTLFFNSLYCIHCIYNVVVVLLSLKNKCKFNSIQKLTWAGDSHATAGQKATAVPVRTHRTAPTFLHNYHIIYLLTSVSQCCLIVFKPLPH